MWPLGGSPAVQPEFQWGRRRKLGEVCWLTRAQIAVGVGAEERPTVGLGGAGGAGRPRPQELHSRRGGWPYRATRGSRGYGGRSWWRGCAQTTSCVSKQGAHRGGAHGHGDATGARPRESELGSFYRRKRGAMLRCEGTCGVKGGSADLVAHATEARWRARRGRVGAGVRWVARGSEWGWG
jgi:hypothetical protein